MTSNMETWFRTLETTEAHQGSGSLHRVYDQFDAFCCLGIGCAIAGIVHEFDDTAYRYGAAGRNDLAPREFIEWLGLDVPGETAAGREAYDIVIVSSDDQPVYDRDGNAISAAIMNDDADGGVALTFKQIAQTLRHFDLVAR